MYLRNIVLENIGAIENLNLELPFEGEKPKPVILVGANGAGKSITLSHIVNSMLQIQQAVYDNTEVEKGKVYKYRSPNYIQSGKSHSFSEVSFCENLSVAEIVLNCKKSDFSHEISNKYWAQMKPNESNSFFSKLHNQKDLIKEKADSNCLLYYPPNRFEEPAWLNLNNLNSKAEYTEHESIQGYTNRKIIQYSSMKENQDWLLDILFDQYVFERKIQNMPFQAGESQVLLPVLLDTSGTGTTLYKEALKILQTVLRQSGNLRFGVGSRGNRTVSVMLNEQAFVPNIFQLSTGQTALLNLFLGILRDFDLSNASFNKLDDVRGIVVIDEVDLHLHLTHQMEVLPELIALFPNVQFIMTSHSPLLGLGLQKKLSDDGFAMYNLPDGMEINVEQYSEFEKAYSYLQDSDKYKSDMKTVLTEAQNDLLFVEGDYDICYLKKAAELLGKNEILDNFQLVDSDGYGNINKVWKHFDSKLSGVTPQKIILLYDCDIKANNTNKGNVYKRTMPPKTDTVAHPIEKGIENLFSRETLNKALEHKAQFIDISESYKKTTRGNSVTVPEKWELCTSEKRNLCNWLCENGDASDFDSFSEVFDIIESFVVLAESVTIEEEALK